MTEKVYCNDYGDRPGCLGEADPRYVMDFGEGQIIHWCAFCGPEAHRLNNVLTKAFETRGPEFLEEFSTLVHNAEKERKTS